MQVKFFFFFNQVTLIALFHNELGRRILGGILLSYFPNEKERINILNPLNPASHCFPALGLESNK